MDLKFQNLMFIKCSLFLCFHLPHVISSGIVLHLFQLLIFLGVIASYSQVDTPSCSARELSLAAARLDAHLYWSISSRLDEERWEGPNLLDPVEKQADSGSANGKGGVGPKFVVGGTPENQDQSGQGEQNGSVTTDQSESEA